MIVLPDVEYHTIVSSFMWTKHWNVHDGQTDRQISSAGCYSGRHCEHGRAEKSIGENDLLNSKVL